MWFVEVTPKFDGAAAVNLDGAESPGVHLSSQGSAQSPTLPHASSADASKADSRERSLSMAMVASRRDISSMSPSEAMAIDC